MKEGSTQSQKIRFILYRLWQQNNEGFTDFEEYYKDKTGKYIDFLTKKLDSSVMPYEE